MYDEIKVRIEGVAPLLLHNGALANPMNQFARELKKVSSKRTKSDSDHEEMARIEWFGGLYTDEQKRACIPGEMIEASIRDAGKQNRKGKQCSGGIICEGLFPIEHEGPKELEKMFETGKYTDQRMVVVQKSRILRTRPVFQPGWSLSFLLHYRGDVFNKEQMVDLIKLAGSAIGLGDYRPRFGRFQMVS